MYTVSQKKPTVFCMLHSFKKSGYLGNFGSKYSDDSSNLNIIQNAVFKSYRQLLQDFERRKLQNKK